MTKNLPALAKYIESFAVALHSDGKVYLSGGFDSKAAHNSVHALDQSMQSPWKEVPSLNHARWRHSSLSIDAYLYALGGVDVGSIE